MQSPRQYSEECGKIQFDSLPSCHCCPYGYHIDLDFVRYVESLADIEPSDGELLRRDKRRSRLSKEFMLGLESLYNWQPPSDVEPVQEVQFEYEPESPRVANNKNSYNERDFSRYLFNDDHQFDDSSPTSTISITKNSLPETSAFVHDALDEVVSDFERTLERTKKKVKRNDEHFSWDIVDNLNDIIDSCVTRNKSKTTTKNEYFGTTDFKPSKQKQLLQNDTKISQILLPEKDICQQDNNVIIKTITTSETDGKALEIIRIKLAKSAKRMEELETEVKNIPVLQKQLTALREEKLQLQLQLQKEENTNTYLKKQQQIPPIPPIRTSSKTNTIQFTPQRISPVSLESLGSRIRSTSQSTDSDNQSKSLPLPLPQQIKRDVSTMCVQHTKDIGVSTNVTILRSIGTNPTNTININDTIYTKRQLDEIIGKSLKDQEENINRNRLNNKVTVGTQMVIKRTDQSKHVYVQTLAAKPVLTISQSSMARPITRDAFTTVKPDTRTIGSSDHKTSDNICEKCTTVTRRTVGTDPDEQEWKNYLALKQVNKLPPRSLTFSLGDNEKLNIKRKTIGTQYKIESFDMGVQYSVQMDSIGIQNTPISVTKSCQYIADNITKQTDTRGLIKLVNGQTNTEPHKEKITATCNMASNTDIFRTRDYGFTTDILKTKELGTNTNIFRTREYGTNTAPQQTRTKHSSSNTDEIHKKDIGCGDIIKPHISIACADNYCDSCKDSIKNLAKEFSKILASPILGGNLEQSRIPRPTTLASPRTSRKLFKRQNTYTVASPSPSPVREKESIMSAITTKTFSISLDSLNKQDNPTGIEKNEDSLSQSLHEQGIIVVKEEDKTIAITKLPPNTIIDTKEKEEKPKQDESSLNKPDITTVTLPLLQESISGDDNSKEIKEIESKMKIYPESSRPSSSSVALQNMLLNQIATATSEPREKTSPTKEMRAALKVIHDSLQKSTSKSNNLKNANSIVQKEWFKISSTDKANPLDVEDYLDCFEEISNSVLKYMVNIADTNGNTAMHYAVSHGNFDVVSILLDSKVCNVNQMNNAGYTCVMLVSLAKLKNSAHRTVVQRLFQMADVNIRAKKHCQTALMLAVSHGNLDMVEMLLNAGADINIQDEDGSTSLMCAAEHGRIDIVKHLLSQKDCDSLIQDVDGSTAFKIAWQAGHRDIGLLLYVHEQMLRSKMPNRKSPVTPRHNKHHLQQSSHQQQSSHNHQQQPPPSST